nr:oligosaccharide flippase family protein [Plesiomonas shigelloides]
MIRKNNRNYLAGALISGLISILSIPLLTWYFSVKDIAVSALFLVVVNFATTLGTLAMEQFILRVYYESNDQERTEIYTNTYLLSLITFIAGSSISVFFWRTISNSIYYEDSFIGFALLLISIISNLSIKFTSITLRLERESLYYSLGQILQRGIVLLFVFVICELLKMKMDWLFLCALTTFSFVFTSLFQHAVCIKHKYITFKSNAISLAVVTKGLKYSIPLLGSLLIIWATSSLDKVLLQRYTSSHELGLYANAFKFAGAALLLQQLVTTIWAPLSIKWFTDEFDKVIFKITLEIVVLLSIVFYFLFYLAIPLLKYIIHPDFYESLSIMPILITFPIFFLISEFANVGVVFKKRSDLSLISSLVTSIFTCVIFFILIPQYGADGAAYAVSLSYFIMLSMRSITSNYCWENIYTPLSVFGVFSLLILPAIKLSPLVVIFLATPLLIYVYYKLKKLRTLI